jgi:Flp pilus assembly protein TadG
MHGSVRMPLNPLHFRSAAVARRSARRTTASRGQAVVEFALILPVLIVLAAVTVDLGRIAFARVTLENAAREGAFQAARTPTSYVASGGCPGDGATNLVVCRTQLESRGSPISIAPSDITMTCTPDCSPGIGHNATVNVTGRFNLVTPLLAVFFGGSTSLAIGSTATAQIETLPDPPGRLPWPTPVPTPSPSASGSPSPSPSTIGCTPPSAGFTFTTQPSSGQAPVTLFVVDTSTFPNCPINDWEWAWGDGTRSFGQTPAAHNYGSAGSYSVTLTVTNVAGRNTTGAVIIRVK